MAYAFRLFKDTIFVMAPILYEITACNNNSKVLQLKEYFLNYTKIVFIICTTPTHWALQFWVRGSNTTKFTE
jgi:hypothetical protein